MLFTEFTELYDTCLYPLYHYIHIMDENQNLFVLEPKAIFFKVVAMSILRYLGTKKYNIWYYQLVLAFMMYIVYCNDT